MDASGTLRGWAIFALTAILCLIVLAVAIFDPNPSHKPETEPAVITIGDPQVYARETLINDRRQEVEYLNKLIEESVTRDFAPQIVRDLKAFERIRAVANVSAGPPSADDRDQITSSSTPAQPDTTTPARAEAPDKPAKADAQPEKDEPSEPKRTLPGISPLDEFRDRQAYRAELRAALAAVNLDDLHDFGGNALYRLQFNATILPATAKENYGVAHIIVRRPRITKTELEDLFYAWISRASQRINQAYVPKDGPKGGEVQKDLYKLVGEATRIYERVEVCRSDCTKKFPRQIELLVPPVAQADFVDGLALSALKTIDGRSAPDAAVVAQLKEALVRQPRWPQQPSEARGYEIFPGCGLQTKGGLTGRHIATIRRVLHRSHGARMAYAALVGLEKYWLSTGGLEHLPGRLAEMQKTGEEVRGHLLDIVSDRYKCAQYLDRAFARLPDAFLKAVLTDKNCFQDTLAGDAEKLKEIGGKSFWKVKVDPKKYKKADPSVCRVSGYAFAYGTTPVELAQRISTNTSFARSLELAVAASAPLGDIGSAKQALEFVSDTARRIDAAERLPLTVGYSTRAPLGDGQKASFGWVFGPSLRTDPVSGKALLTQVPRSEALTADLSVPTWWQDVYLDLETAWVAGWDKGTDPVGGAKYDKGPSIWVRFPRKAADLDTLTEKLLGEFATSGSGRLPFIERIRPNDISICAGETTFVIKGANIWRGTEVFLGGIKATSISVLPDMEGIAATFDMAQAYTQPPKVGPNRAFDPTHENAARSTEEESNRVRAKDEYMRTGPNTRRLVLSVATRNGSTETEITVTAEKGKQNCATTSLLNAPRGRLD